MQVTSSPSKWLTATSSSTSSTSQPTTTGKGEGRNQFHYQPTELTQKVGSFLTLKESRRFSVSNKSLFSTLSPRSTLDVDKWRLNLAQDFETFEQADHLRRLGGYQLPDMRRSEQDYPTKNEFFEALANNCRSLYIFLRKHPERLNEQDERGMTILHHSASIGIMMGSNSASLIHQLLFNADGIDFTIKDENGNTPVHIAGCYAEDRVTCDYIFPNFVRKAISLGFDCTTRGVKGLTILHLSALNAYTDSWFRGRRENLSHILAILKENKIPNLKAVLDTLSDSGSTALYYCVNHLLLKEARELLEAGADPQLCGAPDRNPVNEVGRLKQDIQAGKTGGSYTEQEQARLDELNQSLVTFEEQLKKHCSS
ncbi:ankyrin repeat protein [Oxalobacteraceae bacterium GrIS 2.11]